MESSGLICYYGVNLTQPHLFKKNTKKLQITILFENKQTNAKFDWCENLWNNFLAILQLCTLYIEYKKSKIHGS